MPLSLRSPPQQPKRIAEIICPDYRRDIIFGPRTYCVVHLGAGQEHAIAREQCPFAADGSPACVAVVNNTHGHHATRCLSSNYRCQVEVAVADVQSQNTARLQQTVVQPKTLLRQKVNWHCIAAERIHNEHIKLLNLTLGAFLFNQDSRVADFDANIRRTVFQVGEVAIRKTDNLRIYFIKTD